MLKMTEIEKVLQKEKLSLTTQMTKSNIVPFIDCLKHKTSLGWFFEPTTKIQGHLELKEGLEIQADALQLVTGNSNAFLWNIEAPSCI